MSPLRLFAGLLRALLIAIAASLFAFVLLDLAGPDPVYADLGRFADREAVEDRRAQLGLDASLPIRFARFLGELAQGEFGRVRVSSEPILPAILSRLPVSLLAIAPGYLLGHLLGLIWAGWHLGRGPAVRSMSSLFSALGMAIPLVTVIFAVHALASAPGSPLASHGWSHASPGMWLRHALAPTVALALAAAGFHFAFYRDQLASMLGADHLRAARAHGHGRIHRWLHDLLRPLLPLILQRILLGLPIIALGGSLLIESYFAIPGIGRLLADALGNGDERVIMVLALFGALAFALAQWMLDAISPWLDPRLAGSRA